MVLTMWMPPAWKSTKPHEKNIATSTSLSLTAVVNEHTGRAEYKRIDNGDRPSIRQRIRGQWVDVEIGNEWIVSYSPYLLLKYQLSHMR